jgi:hypothetical protein
MLGIMRTRGLDPVINHILEQEARLFSKNQKKALFVTKRETGKRGKDGKTVKDKEGKGDKPKKDRPKCTHCKRTGHLAEGCWKLHPELKPVANVAQESGDEYPLLVAATVDDSTALSAVSSSDVWVCDSGASSHICNDRASFVDLKAVPAGQTLRTAGKEKLPIEGKGSVRLELTSGKKVILTDVLYVPKCTGNLVSIRQLDAKGIRTTIAGGSLRAELTNGKLLFNAESRRGLYMLDTSSVAFKVFEDYDNSQQTTY